MRKLKLGILMGKFPSFTTKKKTDLYLFKNQKIMTNVIIASVTIMGSVTYGKCNLWQTYYTSVIMANVTEP